MRVSKLLAVLHPELVVVADDVPLAVSKHPAEERAAELHVHETELASRRREGAFEVRSLGARDRVATSLPRPGAGLICRSRRRAPSERISAATFARGLLDTVPPRREAVDVCDPASESFRLSSCASRDDSHLPVLVEPSLHRVTIEACHVAIGLDHRAPAREESTCKLRQRPLVIGWRLGQKCPDLPAELLEIRRRSPCLAETRERLTQPSGCRLPKLVLAALEGTRLDRAGSCATQRRELRWKVGDDELEDVLRREILEVVLSQVSEVEYPRDSGPKSDSLVDSETSTWPPFAAAQMRAARWTSSPR